MRVALIGALAACSFPTKHAGTGDGGPGDTRASDGRFLDGPTGDGAVGPFACQGQAFPTTAPPTITLTGTVQAALNGQPLGGIMVDGYLRNNPNPVVQLSSDASGHVTQQLPTGGQSLDGYVTASQPTIGYQTTVYYPNRPFNADSTALFVMFTQQDLQTFYSQFGRTWNPNLGTIAFQLVDCNGQPVAGARLIDNDPPALILYADTNGVYSTTLQMTSANGNGLVLSATALASATFTAVGPQGQAFHSYNNPIGGGQFVEMALQP